MQSLPMKTLVQEKGQISPTNKAWHIVSKTTTTEDYDTLGYRRCYDRGNRRAVGAQGGELT